MLAKVPYFGPNVRIVRARSEAEGPNCDYHSNGRLSAVSPVKLRHFRSKIGHDFGRKCRKSDVFRAFSGQ